MQISHFLAATLLAFLTPTFAAPVPQVSVGNQPIGVNEGPVHGSVTVGSTLGGSNPEVVSGSTNDHVDGVGHGQLGGQESAGAGGLNPSNLSGSANTDGSGSGASGGIGGKVGSNGAIGSGSLTPSVYGTSVTVGGSSNGIPSNPQVPKE